jgi:hypothetical protein
VEKINKILFIIFLCYFSNNSYAQIDKAKLFITSSLANCMEAVIESNNALSYLDSANVNGIDIKTKERYIRLAESEIISSKRMVIFSEDEAENAMKITDEECENASKFTSPIFIEIASIIGKQDEASIQLNLWINEKELRNEMDFTGTCQNNLKEAILKFTALLKTIEISKEAINNCK